MSSTYLGYMRSRALVSRDSLRSHLKHYPKGNTKGKIVMSLLSTLARMIDNNSQNYVQFDIPPEQVKNVKYNPRPIAAGSGYFRVWAVEIRINKDTWLVTHYPVLHSVVGFDYAGKRIELTRVTSLESLKTSTKGNFEMGKVVALNFLLTDLVPFSGGTVEISAGLLAMKEKDRIQEAIKIVTDFSSLLAVPQLAAALSIVQPLANNVEHLVGFGDNQFRLGYHNTFTSAQGGGSNDLRPQYIAIIAPRPDDQVLRTGVDHWVDKDHLYYIDPDPEAPNKTRDIPCDYILLRLEVRRSRYTEWNNLTDLNESFMEAKRWLPKDREKADEQLSILISKVLTSPDIAENDRTKIVETVRDKYNDYVKVLNARPEPLGIGDESEEVETLADALADVDL